MKKEKINVADVKKANVWLWSIGRSRTGQFKTFEEVKKFAKKEDREIQK